VARLLLELIPSRGIAGIGTPRRAHRGRHDPSRDPGAGQRLCRLSAWCLGLGDMLIAPRLGRLRLIILDDGHADYAIGWLRRIVGVAGCSAARSPR